MLPTRIRDALFERLSDRTMRFVEEVSPREATGLTAEVYEMVAEDLFINGSITCHSAVPELMAGMWCGGRESVLVTDRLERATKEAMSHVLAEFNGCPYCEDMTVSLVTAAGQADLLSWTGETGPAPDTTGAEPLLAWTEAIANGRWDAAFPRGAEAFPEAVGTVAAFSYIPRVSHVVMDGSPLEAPLGARTLRRLALRLFSNEVRHTMDETLEPGRALGLLPPAEPPVGLEWAAGNPRLQQAHARWRAAVIRHADRAVPPTVRETVERRVADWDGEPLPMSRRWVDDEVAELDPDHRDLARFGLLVALAPYQVDATVVEPVLAVGDQARFVRVLAWAAMTGARRVADGVAAEHPDLQADAPAAHRPMEAA